MAEGAEDREGGNAEEDVEGSPLLYGHHQCYENKGYRVSHGESNLYSRNTTSSVKRTDGPRSERHDFLTGR